VRLPLVVVLLAVACARVAPPIEPAKNAGPLARRGCPFEPCPPDLPHCVPATMLSSRCGGAMVRACEGCPAGEAPFADACGECTCAPDCRLPLAAAPAPHHVCDVGTGSWRPATCREGAPCAAHETCTDEGCVAGVCMERWPSAPP
jgi:hypothetical protein